MEEPSYDGNALIKLFDNLADAPASVFLQHPVAERRAITDLLGPNCYRVVPDFRAWVKRHRKSALSIPPPDNNLHASLDPIWQKTVHEISDT